MKILTHILLITGIFLLLTNSAEISIGHNDASLLQKRKIYCSMMSYHFLDDDMDTFKQFTEGFSELRTQVFRAKVATKLSENCQEKLTNQQLIELSTLVERPKHHEEEIQSLEHKYIEYFTPEENIVLKLLQEVKNQTDAQLKYEQEKYNTARKEIEQHTKGIAKGFQDLERHINQTGHHAINGLKNFYQSMFHIHGNFTQGWSKFQEGLTQAVQNITGVFSSRAQQIHAHPHVQKVKQIWNGFWDEDL